MSVGPEFGSPLPIESPDSDREAMTGEIESACMSVVQALGEAWAEVDDQIRQCIESAGRNVDACQQCVYDGLAEHLAAAQAKLGPCKDDLRRYISLRVDQAQEYYALCGGEDIPLPPNRPTEGVRSATGAPPTAAQSACIASGPDIGLLMTGETLAQLLVRTGQAPYRDGQGRCVAMVPYPVVGTVESVIPDAYCLCMEQPPAPPTPPPTPPPVADPPPPPPVEPPPYVSPPPVQPPPPPVQPPQPPTSCPPGYRPNPVPCPPGQLPANPLFPWQPGDEFRLPLDGGPARQSWSPGDPVVGSPVDPYGPPGVACNPCIPVCPTPPPCPTSPPPTGPDAPPPIPYAPPPPAVGRSCQLDAYSSGVFIPSLLSTAEATTAWLLAQFGQGVPPGETLFSWATTLGVDSVASGLGGLLSRQIGSFLKQTMNAVNTIMPCSSANYLSSMTLLNIAGLGSKWISSEMEPAMWPLRYATYVQCPTQFPSAAQAARAWLSGAIPDEILRTWVEQNNQCWAPYERIIYGDRQKPSVAELNRVRDYGLVSEDNWRAAIRNLGVIERDEQEVIWAATERLLGISEAMRIWQWGDFTDQQLAGILQYSGVRKSATVRRLKEAARSALPPEAIQQLRRREVIDEQGHRRMMMANGYTDDREINGWTELLKVVPPISDLARFMVRDVEDPAIVDRFGLDDDFDAKFAGQLERWAKDQGVDENYMRYVWRAHWSIPSPSALFSMMHRLSRLPADDPAATTIEDVETALRQQDILPFWIPRLLKLAYRPLTRVDVRRAYDIGALTKNDVEESYRQLGYDESNAKTLSDFAERLRNARAPAEKAVRMYRAGALTENAARDRLTDKQYPQDVIDRVFRDVEREEEAAVTARCIAALRIRFLRMEFDRAVADGKLQGLGVPAMRSDRMIRGWECELQARGREVNAGMLCRWRTLGIIDAGTQYLRLVKLGWSQEDAARIVFDCNSTIDQKQRKELAKQLKQEEQQAAKQKREAERAAKDSQRQVKQLEDMRERNRKLKERREKALMGAAKTLAAALSIDIADAYPLIRDEHRRVTSDWAFSPDERIEVIVLAAERQAKEPGTLYSDLVTATAQARAALDRDVPPQLT